MKSSAYGCWEDSYNTAQLQPLAVKLLQVGMLCSHLHPQPHNSSNCNLNQANHPKWQSSVEEPHHSSRNDSKSIAAEDTERLVARKGSAGSCITPVLCQCSTTHLSLSSLGGNHSFLVNQMLLFQPHTAKRHLEPWGQEERGC